MPKIDDEYLGDGVYASVDGDTIKLDVRGQREDVIFLERETFSKLMAYAQRGFTRECQFQPGDSVTYVPTHANGDRTHKDCEHGVVHRIGPATTVFVNFAIPRVQGCEESDLVKG